jgi:hypothetical protein
MILPNPHPWFSHRTCHQLALSAAVREATLLLARESRSAGEDAELVRAAHCVCECAGLIDPPGTTDRRVHAGLLLARALLATGRHQQAADQAHRVQRLARKLPWAAEATVQAALIGISAWEALGQGEHADHLRILARLLIETLTDGLRRAHLTRSIDGTTVVSPSTSDHYRPHPIAPEPPPAHEPYDLPSTPC